MFALFPSVFFKDVVLWQHHKPETVQRSLSVRYTDWQSHEQRRNSSILWFISLINLRPLLASFCIRNHSFVCEKTKHKKKSIKSLDDILSNRQKDRCIWSYICIFFCYKISNWGKTNETSLALDANWIPTKCLI